MEEKSIEGTGARFVLHPIANNLKSVLARLGDAANANYRLLLVFHEDYMAGPYGRRNKPLSLGRQAKLLYTMKGFADFLGGVALDDFTEQHIRDYKRALTKKGYSLHTIEDFKRCTRGFLKWYVRRLPEEKKASLMKLLNYEECPELAGDDPYKHDECKIKADELPSDEECLRVLGAAKTPRDRALIACLIESGCRIGEILCLRLKDLVFLNGSCYIHVTGKTGSRKVKLNQVTGYLRDWANTHPHTHNPDAPLWISRGERETPAV